MADVEVKFGAQLDGLVAGINQAKEQLQGITAPISGIVSAFQGLGEAAVAALAVDKVVEFTERYADLGEQIERTSQILGISTDQVQELGFAIRMGGGDAETATLTIGILEKNIAEAASGSGTAATAFENMGIAVKDADGNTRSAVDILKDMADVLSKVSDANIRAEYGRALLGRGYQNLLPVLLEGRDGFDKLNAILDQTNSKLSNDQVKALDESAKKTKELSATWDGFMIELGADTAWTHAKQDAIDLTQGMTTLAKSIGDATRSLGEFLGLADQKAEPTALNEFTAAAAKFKVAMAKVNGTGGQVFGPNLPPGIKLPSLGKDETAKDTGKEDDTENQIALDQIKTQEELAKQGLQTQKDLLEQEVAAKQITKAQEFATLQDYLGLEYQVESEALAQKLDLYEADSREYQEALNQKELLDATYQQQTARLAAQGAQAQAEEAKKTQEAWKPAFDSIGSGFDQVIGGILQGTQTWEQAMAKLFGDLAIKFIEAVAKMIAEWAVFEETGGAGFLGFGAANPFAGLAAAIPSFETGTTFAPGGLAFLHPGEIVIPPVQSAAIRSGSGSLGGGGAQGNFTINVNAIDTQTGAQFLKANAGVIAQSLSGQARNLNPNLRM